ncbi:hypothetical protein GCM10007908_12050 [Rhizobium albus]|nr:hypothetical protein GCM10007908_12050 [Rhizobium albus]
MSNALRLFERIVRNSSKADASKSYADPLPVHPFDERNLHPEVAAVAVRLFDDGHYSEATFAAFKLLEKSVKKASGCADLGFNLMMTAFNEGKPVIKLNSFTSDSDKDEQKGYRHIFAGAMSGIRNPRGHDNRQDPIDLCLDHLVLSSLLLRILEGRIEWSPK